MIRFGLVALASFGMWHLSGSFAPMRSALFGVGGMAITGMIIATVLTAGVTFRFTK